MFNGLFRRRKNDDNEEEPFQELIGQPSAAYLESVRLAKEKEKYISKTGEGQSFKESHFIEDSSSEEEIDEVVPLSKPSSPSDVLHERESGISRARKVFKIIKKHHKHKKVGWKTFIAALLMMIFGIGLFILGLVVYIEKKKGLEVLIIGSILLLPGIYSSTIIFGSFKQWKGFNSRNLPSYD